MANIEKISYTSIIEKSNTYTSYISYDLDLALSNTELTYMMNNINKTYISNNLLVMSMVDDKMYYNQNTVPIPSYQYNNIVFINNEKQILPLTLNIKNLDSPLTIENDEIKLKIDNNTIIDSSYSLKGDYTTLSLAKHKPGLFKVDDDSLLIENNHVTLSYTIKDVIDNIDDHIEIMENVINQCSYNLNDIISIFKEYSLYDKKYSCNTNIKYPVYYSDENNNDILLKNVVSENIQYSQYYIDYYKKYFKLKIKFVYNYQSSNLSNFNPFNENNIHPKISLDNDNSLDINTIIKFNLNKSYIFNDGITYLDEVTNNIYGEVNYICYFDIDTDALYRYVNIFKQNNDDPNTTISYKTVIIDIDYEDKLINSTSSTKIKLDLFIDYYKDNKIHKILYHSYDVGFNYDGIGNMVGICMISQDNKKDIFLKYFNNENNYVINNISKDIIERYGEFNKDILNYDNYGYPKSFNTLSSNAKNYLSQNINFNIDKYYRNIDLKSLLIGQYQHLISNINSNNTSNIFKLYNKYCFNATYNICGNGLHKGDCYVPSIDELAIFYIFGFKYYLSYVDNETNSNILYSSTFFVEDNKLKVINISEYIGANDYTDNNSNNIALKHYFTVGNSKISKIVIDKDGNIKQILDNNENSSSSIYNHISISLFKIPDISVLNRESYYLSYDKIENCEIINCSTRRDIRIRIKCNNEYIINENIILSKINLVCNDSNVQINSLSILVVQKNIYDISFNLDNYTNNYNEIDMYYLDSDISFNNCNIDGILYRKICRISVKIE